MNIQDEELRALLGLLGMTNAQELNCEEFLSQTPGYLEMLRDRAPKEIQGYQGFLHHLKICPECQEEFDILCVALRDGML